MSTYYCPRCDDHLDHDEVVVETVGCGVEVVRCATCGLRVIEETEA
jgi:transcription elongation factor Elf1